MQSQTHDLRFVGTEVHKRFLNWADGEADREWGCLTLIWEQAPGIAPRPLRRENLDGHPVVVMQRLPGESLGRRALTADQTASLGRTLHSLYSIPLEQIRAAGVKERRHGPSTLPRSLSDWLRAPCDYSACQDGAQVAAAVDAARDWLAQPVSLPDPHIDVLGIADLNPANIVWDGQTCRLVDFEDGGLTDSAYDLADHVEHIAGRLGGVFDPEALTAAVGDRRGCKSTDARVPPPLGGMLARDAPPRQWWLPPQSAGNNGSSGAPRPAADRVRSTALPLSFLSRTRFPENNSTVIFAL